MMKRQAYHRKWSISQSDNNLLVTLLGKKGTMQDSARL